MRKSIFTFSVQSVALGLFATLLLTSCGKSSGAAVVCTQQYWNGEVGVCLPDGWTAMSSERMGQLGVPADVVAAFQATQPTAGQFPNVTITKEALAQPVTAPDYSKAAIRSVSTLPGYQMIDTQPATIEKQSVSVHVYSAQPVADQPRSRFYQISTVSESGTGFTVTAYVPLTVTSTLEQQVLLILKSLTFTEPKGGGTTSSK